MDYKKAYRAWRTIKYILMFGVPLTTAGLMWGVFKEPTNNSTMGRFALGTFIIGFMIAIFFADFIRSQVEQMKIDKRVAFIKNRAIQFFGIGILFFIARIIADDAITFCFIGFLSHAVAYGAEMLEKKYYRLYKPLPIGG